MFPSFDHSYCLYLWRGVFSGQALPGVHGPTGKRLNRKIHGCVSYSRFIFIHVKEFHQVRVRDQMPVY